MRINYLSNVVGNHVNWIIRVDHVNVRISIHLRIKGVKSVTAVLGRTRSIVFSTTGVDHFYR